MDERRRLVERVRALCVEQGVEAGVRVFLSENNVSLGLLLEKQGITPLLQTYSIECDIPWELQLWCIAKDILLIDVISDGAYGVVIYRALYRTGSDINNVVCKVTDRRTIRISRGMRRGA